jgi:uncharacterized membrane protein (UPF0127 family)
MLILLACGRQESGPQDRTDAEEQTDARPLHTITINGVPLKVEIAQDPETRTHGLMFREDMPEDEGMLFVFSEQRILSFWMRNTFIPLDIAFINSEGIIVDIQRMEPLDESKQYLSSAPALYALEVNAGWFEKHNVKAGGKVSF